jgi:hypothetical protein
VVSVKPRPRFTPFGTHWIRGWVGPRAGLDAEARRKILCPCRGSNPDRPVRHYTAWATATPITSADLRNLYDHPSRPIDKTVKLNNAHAPWTAEREMHEGLCLRYWHMQSGVPALTSCAVATKPTCQCWRIFGYSCDQIVFYNERRCDPITEWQYVHSMRCKSFPFAWSFVRILLVSPLFVFLTKKHSLSE